MIKQNDFIEVVFSEPITLFSYLTCREIVKFEKSYESSYLS